MTRRTCARSRADKVYGPVSGIVYFSLQPSTFSLSSDDRHRHPHGVVVPRRRARRRTARAGCAHGRCRGRVENAQNPASHEPHGAERQGRHDGILNEEHHCSIPMIAVIAMVRNRCHPHNCRPCCRRCALTPSIVETRDIPAIMGIHSADSCGAQRLVHDQGHHVRQP